MIIHQFLQTINLLLQNTQWENTLVTYHIVKYKFMRDSYVCFVIFMDDFSSAACVSIGESDICELIHWHLQAMMATFDLAAAIEVV